MPSRLNWEGVFVYTIPTSKQIILLILLAQIAAMKNAILFFLLLTCSVTCFAQQPAANNPDPHIYYKNGTLRIEPAGYVMISYQVSLLRKHSGDLLGPYSYSPGRASSNEATNILLTAKPGDTIYFDEIKVRGLDNRIRSYSPLTIKVE